MNRKCWNLLVYPNPTTSDISIEIHKPQNEKENIKGLKQTESQTPYELQLWNATTMLKRLKTTEKTTQMHLGNLPKGIYFLHLIKNGKVHKQIDNIEVRSNFSLAKVFRDIKIFYILASRKVLTNKSLWKHLPHPTHKTIY